MNGMEKHDFQELDLDFKRIFYLVLNNFVWIILGVVIAYAAAWTYLRYTPTVYRVSGRILINENQQQPISENIIAQELGFVSPINNNNLENELQIFGSSYMMRRVVDSLNLQIEYYNEGRIKTSEIYKNCPISVESVTPINRSYGKSFKVRVKNNNEFSLIKSEEDTVNVLFGENFNLNGLKISLKSNFPSTPEGLYIIKFKNPASIARRYANKVNISKIEGSNVLELTIKEQSYRKGIDVLNTLISAYGNSVLEKKIESGRKTLSFIDERLDFITTELYDVEKEVEGYKQDKSFPLSIEERATQFLSQTDQVDLELTELQMNEGLLKSFQNYLTVDSNQYNILPSTSELVSGAVTEKINKYNDLIFQRENLLENATPENPFYITFDEELSFLRESILLGIQTQLQEIEQKKKFLEEHIQPLTARIE
jgi:tyrosine-protein kinase Etk/Wzc